MYLQNIKTTVSSNHIRIITLKMSLHRKYSLSDQEITTADLGKYIKYLNYKSEKQAKFIPNNLRLHIAQALKITTW